MAATKLAINRGADAAAFRNALQAGARLSGPLYAATTEVGGHFQGIRSTDGLRTQLEVAARPGSGAAGDGLKSPICGIRGAKTLSIEARIISAAARAFSRLRGGHSIMASPRTAKAMAPAGAPPKRAVPSPSSIWRRGWPRITNSRNARVRPSSAIP